MSSTSKEPGFQHALLTFAAIVSVIGVGLFHLQTSLHSLMLICLIVGAGSALILGYSYKDIHQAMNNGIKTALSAIYIFILIGVVIAAFIESGTLATLVYYGISFIDPVFFLPAGLILCSLMSLATGTSWGTVGTAGVVLMSIGACMGLPLPLIAGMVISGACFGDKMSPVSDTTNLSAMSSKTSLYAHIKSMSYTTGPVYLICLAIFTWLGMGYSSNTMPTQHLNTLMVTLENHFSLSLITLLPLLVMLVLSVRQVAAEVAMVAATATAVLLALLLQGTDISTVLNSLFNGGSVQTGVEQLDSLLSRGGINSMMGTLSLSLMALALGGILDRFGFLRVLITGVVRRVKRRASLVATTIISVFFGNLAMGEAYMSIILGGQLFGDSYDARQIDRSVMSRSLEEGATLTTALIPWTTGGAFFAATLGVPVLDYAPWALLNWINPLVSIVFAYMGIALFRSKVVKDNAQASQIER
ncbi:Na+/H+ antiporter NhaC [Endozoicomonas elysicola]|uniref:Sodium:proton antiporter n=1 Tax=Endozoicomonas elysicola TaxID=305900 RepID=A0A081K7A6_9GAMM|nr:Na+/H+ antiporter NhaC [Endozoicomonas elysicola]KEI70032.1 sodium:proton antiporter [Endozoicomonas elysicola]